MAVPRSGNTPTRSAALGWGYLRRVSCLAASCCGGGLIGAAPAQRTSDPRPGHRPRRRRRASSGPVGQPACGALRCLRGKQRRPHDGLGLSLEPGSLRRLCLGLSLRGTGLRGRFIRERLALVDLLHMCGDVLAHLLGLDVSALVSLAPRREHDSREHNHRHNCDDDPKRWLFMAVPFVGKSRWSLTHPLISDSLRERHTEVCAGCEVPHMAHCRFGPTLTLTYSTRPTTSCVGAPSRAPAGP